MAVDLSRRTFLYGACAVTSAFALGAKAGEAQRPNIVFILADDMGYGDLHDYGQTKIATPNIDRLAGEGMRFTQGYAGAPVCAPSRCTLMTGMHGGHARVRDNFALAAGHVGHRKKQEIRRASLDNRGPYRCGVSAPSGLSDRADGQVAPGWL